MLALPYVGGSVAGRISDWLEDVAERPVERRPRFVRLILFLLPPAAPPSMWDSVFNKPWFTRLEDRTCHLVLTFKDGTKIAGLYGNDSEVYQSPEPPGLYLEEEWTVGEDGLPRSRVDPVKAVAIVDTSDVRSVRILLGDASDDQSRRTGSHEEAKAADPAAAASASEIASQAASKAADD